MLTTSCWILLDTNPSVDSNIFKNLTVNTYFQIINQQIILEISYCPAYVGRNLIALKLLMYIVKTVFQQLIKIGLKTF